MNSRDEFGFPIERELWRQFRNTDLIVSTDGRVFNNRLGRNVQPRVRGGKYHAVDVVLDGQRTTLYVHRMVLEVFSGPCPDGMEGCHADGDPSNNKLSNLRWDTKQANAKDTRDAGNFTAVGKFDDHDRAAMFVLTDRLGWSQTQVRELFDCEQSTVSAAIKKFRQENDLEEEVTP